MNRFAFEATECLRRIKAYRQPIHHLPADSIIICEIQKALNQAYEKGLQGDISGDAGELSR